MANIYDADFSRRVLELMSKTTQQENMEVLLNSGSPIVGSLLRELSTVRGDLILECMDEGKLDELRRTADFAKKAGLLSFEWETSYKQACFEFQRRREEIRHGERKVDIFTMPMS